jgi:hypothetical protein
MKLTYKKANQIKQDFQHIIGQQIQTNEGIKEIKEIVVLPILDGSFGTFPVNYLLATDKLNFITPHKDKEMSLMIYFTDNSYIFFFQYLQDRNINLDLSKYSE